MQFFLIWRPVSLKDKLSNAPQHTLPTCNSGVLWSVPLIVHLLDRMFIMIILWTLHSKRGTIRGTQKSLVHSNSENCQVFLLWRKLCNVLWLGITSVPWKLAREIKRLYQHLPWWTYSEVIRAFKTSKERNFLLFLTFSVLH